MSDLEQRLAGVLADAAEDAPGAAGLAEAARRRHRVRRQRRVAAGGAIVALVLGTGAVVVGAVGGEDRAADPTDDPAPQRWQTVEVDSGAAMVSIPADWVAYDCASGDAEAPAIYGPPGRDTCTDGVGAVFLPSGARGETDAGALVSGDGGVLGFVHAGDWEVRAFHADGDLVRRILSTARVRGNPTLEGSTWVTFEREGLTYEVPAWWGLPEEADRSEFSVCLVASDVPGRQAFSTDSSYVMTDRAGPGDVVRVTAPTQAMAELVLATVDRADAVATEDCAPEDFTTGLLPGESSPGDGTPVEGGDRPVDLPTSDWEPGDPSLDAFVGGILTLDGNGCVALANGSGPPALDYVRWPAGYSASVDDAGSVTLRGPDGAVVARHGDRIEAGGGWTPAGAVPEHPCISGSGEVGTVMSEVTVVR